MKAYFLSISHAAQSTLKGFYITFRHIFEARQSRVEQDITQTAYFLEDQGIVTVQYPDFYVPVPDNGRYTLHCEIDDCIVCDKCAKICPVDCIAIEAIKAPEIIGQTSDGTAKRLHAARFDIDMAKCCFCGLCTTVCPTECLTMTDEYDFSTFERNAMIYQFAEMSLIDMANERKLYEDAQSAKAALKAAAAPPTAENETPTATAPTKKAFTPFKPKPISPESAS
jgi:formate hydrogenlyase subunit 6/NADH:ubiquinone oxidoreductase subunit I